MNDQSHPRHDLRRGFCIGIMGGAIPGNAAINPPPDGIRLNPRETE